MTLTCSIDLDNDAFQEDLSYELNHIFEQITHDHAYTDRTFGNCRDTNGNTVGRWAVS